MSGCSSREATTGLQAHNLHKLDPQSPPLPFLQIYQTQEFQPVLALISQPEAEELQASLFYSTFPECFFFIYFFISLCYVKENRENLSLST